MYGDIVREKQGNNPLRRYESLPNSCDVLHEGVILLHLWPCCYVVSCALVPDESSTCPNIV